MDDEQTDHKPEAHVPDGTDPGRAFTFTYNTSGPGMLARAANVLNYGRQGYAGMKLGIDRIRVIGLPAFAFPPLGMSDKERLNMVLNNIVSTFTNRGMLLAVNTTGDSGRLTVYMTGENACCGQPSASGDSTWEFPASNAIPIEWRNAIQSTLLRCSQTISAWTAAPTICSMTTTYDLHVLFNKQPMLSNTCLIAASENNEVFAVDKGMASSIDGMGQWTIADMTGSGRQTKVFEISDIIGKDGNPNGKSVALSVRICLDAAIPKPFDIKDVMRPPDFILCPALGAPRSTGWQSSTAMLVNDTADHTITRVLMGGSGTYTKVTNVAALDGYSISNSKAGHESATVLSEPIIQASGFEPAAFKTEMYTRVGENRVHWVGKNRVIETPTIAIPDIAPQLDIVKSVDGLMNGTISAIDPTGAVAPIVESEDADNGEPPMEADGLAEDMGLDVVMLGLSKTQKGQLGIARWTREGRKPFADRRDCRHYILGPGGVEYLSGAERQRLKIGFKSGSWTITLLQPRDNKVIADVEHLVGFRRLSRDHAEHVAIVSYYVYKVPPSLAFKDSRKQNVVGTVTWVPPSNAAPTSAEDHLKQVHYPSLKRWLKHFEFGWHPSHRHWNAAFDEDHMLADLIPAYYIDHVDQPAKPQEVTSGALSDAPTDLMNEVQQMSDIWIAQFYQGQSIDVNNPSSGAAGLVFPKVAVATIAFGVTWAEPHSKTIKDVYYVAHACEFSPPGDPFMDGFTVRSSMIDPLEPTPYICNSSDLYPAMVEAKTGWTDNSRFLAAMDLTERFFCYTALQVRTPAPPGELQSPAVLTSAPPTTQNVTTYSSNVSQEIGGNVGFFDASGTGGVSGNASISHGESRSVPDLSIKNRSSMDDFPADATYLFIFNGGDVGANTVQLYTQNIFVMDDDGKGSRDPVTGITQAMQLTVYGFAVPLDSSIVYTWRPIRPLQVAVPPLPPSPTPPSAEPFSAIYDGVGVVLLT